MNKILPFFSYLFHPLFVPLYAVLLFFGIDENYLVLVEKALILAQVFIITILIPVAFFLVLRSLGKIDTVMVSDVNQRKLPLFLQCILIFMLVRQGISPDRIPELYYFFIGALATSAVALALAMVKFKTSLHMAALGAMLMFIIGLCIHNLYNALGLLAVMLVMTGLVASSRLEMKAHHWRELVFGLVAGAVPQAALWVFWL